MDRDPALNPLRERSPRCFSRKPRRKHLLCGLRAPIVPELVLRKTASDRLLQAPQADQAASEGLKRSPEVGRRPCSAARSDHHPRGPSMSPNLSRSAAGFSMAEAKLSASCSTWFRLLAAISSTCSGGIASQVRRNSSWARSKWRRPGISRRLIKTTSSSGSRARRAGDAVDRIDHQHDYPELALHDLRKPRGRHVAELEFTGETLARCRRLGQPRGFERRSWQSQLEKEGFARRAERAAARPRTRTRSPTSRVMVMLGSRHFVGPGRTCSGQPRLSAREGRHRWP